MPRASVHSARLRARGDITERSPRRPSGRRGLLVGLLALLVAASVSTPALALPPGFEDELVATVSGGPMDTAWTPDGPMPASTTTSLQGGADEQPT